MVRRRTQQLTDAQQKAMVDVRTLHWAFMRQYYKQLSELEQTMRALRLGEGQSPEWYLKLLADRLRLSKELDAYADEYAEQRIFVAGTADPAPATKGL